MFQRICKFLLCLALLLPGSSWAISLDSSGSTTATSSVGQSFSFTNTAGDFLLCYIGAGDAVSTDFDGWTATYAGASMTAIPSSKVYDGGWVGIQGFYKIGPATGTNTVATSTGGLDQVAVMCASFTGVDQTTPLGTAATNSATSGTTASVSVSSATGELVIGGIASDAEDGITETGTLILEAGPVASDTLFGIQYYSGAASVTAQWSQSTNRWAVSGVSIKPASGGGGVTLKNLSLMGVGQ